MRRLDAIADDRGGLVADLRRVQIDGEAVARLGAMLEALAGPLREVRTPPNIGVQSPFDLHLRDTASIRKDRCSDTARGSFERLEM